MKSNCTNTFLLNAKLVALSLLIILVGNTAVLASDSICFYNPPSVTSIDHYTLNDGLASNNLNNVFEDSKGRMWVNPDVMTARQFRTSFFQFDGTKSIFHELKPDSLSKKSASQTWFIMGEAIDGFMYGANRLNKILFYWHPDNGIQYFFKLEANEKLLNMAPHPEGGVLALTVEILDQSNLGNETYRVIHVKNGIVRQVGSIELDFKDDLIPITPKRFEYPFEVIGSTAWFLHQRKGLVKLSLNSGTMEFTPWTDFEGIPLIKKNWLDFPYISFHWNIIGIQEDELLLYLGQQNGFFMLNLHNGKLKQDHRLNERIVREDQAGYMLKVYFARDHKKNVFITSGYYKRGVSPFEVKDFQALLIDEAGCWYNYTGLLDQMNKKVKMDYRPHGRYFSSNFLNEIGSTVMEKGMAVVDLQPDLKNETIDTPIGYGARAMIGVDSSTLLVNRDDRLMLLNLTDDTWTQIGDTVIQLEELSPLISKNGRIWMSKNQGINGTLLSFDPRNNRMDLFPIEREFERFVFINDQEIALFHDNNELYHVGQFLIYNTETRSSRPFLLEGTAFSIESKVNDLLLTGDHSLWAGAQNGLWHFDLSNNKVEHINHHDFLKDVNITCIYQGEDERFWLGTDRNGMLIYDLKTNDVEQVTVQQGLANNVVVGIIVDEQSNRWVATFNGISIVSPKGKVLYNIRQSDGLIDNQVRPSAIAKLPNGKFAFGGTAGISILEPDHILNTLAKKERNLIYLTSLGYYSNEKEQDVAIKDSFNKLSTIHIPAAKRYLNLDFALSSYTSLGQHSYDYRILPAKATVKQTAQVPWINLGAASQVTLNNLPVGEHIVQVRGMDKQLNGVVAPLEIPIMVDDFFYRKWWFYALGALPFLLAGSLYTMRIKGEKNRLEREVMLRTKQLYKDKEVIKEQAVQLQKLDKAKTRFFTNISHEFRTPLTVILGMAEQIRNHIKEKDIIHRNAHQLLRLINEILELGKLEAGNTFASYIQGDIITFLKYLLESFHSLAEQKNIALEFESTAVPLILDYDPEKMNHIVSNLLTNAIKFTPEGGKVRILVELHRNSSPPLYQFSVTDTGIGIAQNKLINVFDRFFQAEDEVNQAKGGVGVGLSLVHELVKLLKGNINVQSVPGQGTTVKVMLPYTNVAQPEPKHLEVFPIEALESGSAEKKPLYPVAPSKNDLSTLLIVEDNRDVAEYLGTCLKDEYRLLFAADGQEGLEITLEKVPDIIISDVMMPRLDGLHMCKEIKHDERTSHIPIILLTAKADIESKLTGLECGADVYLEKPFHKKELRVQLRNLAQTRRRLRERYANLENLEETPDKSIHKEDAFIFRLREIIVESMHEQNFGVGELCKKVGMSRTPLHNKIKALTGHSTSHFIKKVRIHQATRLLRTSEMNISQVALEVGVESLPYFTKIFTKEMGLTPSKYREKVSLKQ
jgi:signal transduction histidine kinase/CheY-like chemotaxis protein/streptogramin lyase